MGMNVPPGDAMRAPVAAVVALRGDLLVAGQGLAEIYIHAATDQSVSPFGVPEGTGRCRTREQGEQGAKTYRACRR